MPQFKPSCKSCYIAGAPEGQAEHGDAPLGGGAYDAAPYDKQEEIVRAQDPCVTEGMADIRQGWTYIADYTFHPLMPRRPASIMYIHAMVTSAGLLRFGVFDYLHGTLGNEGGKPTFDISFPLAQGEQQVRHGDLHPPYLRIAPKAEAEAYMLRDGKLVRQCAPKYAGMLCNLQTARVGTSAGGNGFTVDLYGHLWLYYYTIADNVLYFCGLPLWQGSDRGAIDYDGTTYPVNLPPTAYDLQYGRTGLSTAINSYFEQTEGAWAQPNHKTIFAAKGTDAAVVLCSRPLAMVEHGADMLPTGAAQCYHGDILAGATASANRGGVYELDNKTLATLNYDEAEEAYQPVGLTGALTTGGTSGLIPLGRYAMAGDGSAGWIMQGIECYTAGQCYDIRVGGGYPFYTTLRAADTGGGALPYDAILPVETEADPDIPSVPGIPGGDDDEPEDDDMPPDGVDWEDWGKWYIAGNGVTIATTRPGGDAAVVWRFRLTPQQGEITLHEPVQYNVIYAIRINQEGGTYTYKGETYAMYYFLSGGGENVNVGNRGDRGADGEPPASLTQMQTITGRTMYMTGTYNIDAGELASNGGVASDPLLLFEDTGKYRKRYATTGTPGALRHGKMRIYKITLNKDAVRQRGNELARNLAPATFGMRGQPTSIAGSITQVSGSGPSVVQPPVVTLTFASTQKTTPQTAVANTIFADNLASWLAPNSSIAAVTLNNISAEWNEDGQQRMRNHINISGAFVASYA